MAKPMATPTSGIRGLDCVRCLWWLPISVNRRKVVSLAVGIAVLGPIANGNRKHRTVIHPRAVLNVAAVGGLAWRRFPGELHSKNRIKMPQSTTRCFLAVASERLFHNLYSTYVQHHPLPCSSPYCFDGYQYLQFRNRSRILKRRIQYIRPAGNHHGHYNHSRRWLRWKSA